MPWGSKYFVRLVAVLVNSVLVWSRPINNNKFSSRRIQKEKNLFAQSIRVNVRP